MNKQKLLAQVLLEGRVAEISGRADDERQQAAAADMVGQHRITRALSAPGKRLALSAAYQAKAGLAGRIFGEQLFDIDTQRPRQLQRSGNRRRVQATLDLGKIALGHAGLLGQHLQGNPQFFSQQFQSDRHVVQFSQCHGQASSC
ncbi:hypothetical protein D9M71_517830 [compost metagenome]